MSSASGRGDTVSARVREFYEAHPFPAFDPAKYGTHEDLRSRASAYALLLDDQIPRAARVADIGCGTGQLAALLSLREGRMVLGVDFSPASLRYAAGLRDALTLRGLGIVRGDALRLPLRSDAFDHVLCNGVLHHTADPKGGFRELARITAPGGFVTVGLYHRHGRIAHRVLRWLSGRTGRPGRAIAEWGMRQMLGAQFEEADAEKRRTWLADQFRHPHESTHTGGEVLSWFDELGIEMVAAVPPLTFGGEASRPVLFPRHRSSHRPPALIATVVELTWAVSLWRTGGYFVLVGRKRGTTRA